MKKPLVLLPFFALLASCKNEAPNCSDSETVKLVKKIATDKFEESGIETINIKMEVTTIRTLKKNANTGAYSCAADFNITISDRKKSLPITYTSELLDNKKEFYVTVYGF